MSTCHDQAKVLGERIPLQPWVHVEPYLSFLQPPGWDEEACEGGSCPRMPWFAPSLGHAGHNITFWPSSLY